MLEGPKMASDAKDFLAGFHDIASISPANWLAKGRALWHASEVIWERLWLVLKDLSCPEDAEGLDPSATLDLDLGSIWCMLVGLSLEVLAKGLIIAKEPGRFKSDSKEWLRLTEGHDVLRLVGQTGFTLDKKQKTILEAIEMSVVWEGKYPVPKKRNKMDFPLCDPKDWHETITGLVEHLTAEYKTIEDRK